MFTVEYVRTLGTIAGLALVVITMWRGWQRIKDLGTAVEGLNQKVHDMWFLAESIGSTRPAIVSDLVAYETWDTSLVRGLMASARRRLWILQTWFPEMEGDLDRWRFSDSAELEVIVLLAEAKNPAIAERTRYRDDFRNLGDSERQQRVHNNVEACISRLRYMFDARTTPKALQASIFKYCTGMPFGPIYVIDDTIITGIYPPHVNCNAAMMLRFDARTPAGICIEMAFKTFRQKADCNQVYPTSSPPKRRQTDEAG